MWRPWTLVKSKVEDVHEISRRLVCAGFKNKAGYTVRAGRLLRVQPSEGFPSMALVRHFYWSSDSGQEFLILCAAGDMIWKFEDPNFAEEGVGVRLLVYVTLASNSSSDNQISSLGIM